jgi:predicted metal-dependent hydrolase
MLPLAFWQGVEEFNQQEFYACHDTLELIWMEAEESERNFYQGVRAVHGE